MVRRTKSFIGTQKIPSRLMTGDLRLTGSGFVFFASAGLTLFNVFGLAFKATPSGVPFTRRPIWGG